MISITTPLIYLVIVYRIYSELSVRSRDLNSCFYLLGRNLTCALMLFSSGVSANDSELNFDWDWQVSAESVQSRDSIFLQGLIDHQDTLSTAVQTGKHQSLNAMLDVEATYQQWLGLFAIKATDIYAHSNDSRIETNDIDAEFVVRELFWQGELSLDSIGLSEQYADITLGKIRLDWGVGYGYRPLDVFKPYRRNPVGIVAEEGTGVASVSLFDATGEWTLLYTDSSWSSQPTNDIERQSQQQGVGVRRYAMLDETEYQWLAYYDDVRHGLLGASVVSVLSLAWEFHGSLVYQRDSLGYSQPESLTQSVYLDQQGEAVQALAGLTWANEVGNSVVLEYWYDSRAWSHSDWQKAMNKANILNQSPLTAPISASYTQAYQQANLVQHNVMFHWTLDSSAWSQWEWSQGYNWLQDVTPTFDLLYSPQDTGFIATQWLNVGLMDTGEASVDLELAARFLNGKSSSAYANLPGKHMILLNLKGRF